VGCNLLHFHGIAEKAPRYSYSFSGIGWGDSQHRDRNMSDFFPRVPSAFDVLANTIGAILGALLCALSGIDIRRVVSCILIRAAQSGVLLLTAIVFAAVPLIISLNQFPWFDFHNWDRGYAF
jgi:hypothetical protein